MACGPEPVAVRAAIPNEHGVLTPVARLRVTVLPYDRDSVLAELARTAPPRPDTERLDSLFQAYRAPFADYLRLTAALERARTAAEAPDAALGDSVERLVQRAESARVALARVRDRYQPEIDSLRRVLQEWEDTAFRTYDSVSAALTRRTKAVIDSTGPDGWTTVALPKGRWWIVARAVNVLDPYSEWYWNLAVTADTIHLDTTTGRSRPRTR